MNTVGRSVGFFTDLFCRVKGRKGRRESRWREIGTSGGNSKDLICASSLVRDESPTGDQTNPLFLLTITGAWATSSDKRLVTPNLYEGLDQRFH